MDFKKQKLCTEYFGGPTEGGMKDSGLLNLDAACYKGVYADDQEKNVALVELYRWALIHLEAEEAFVRGSGLTRVATFRQVLNKILDMLNS